MVEEPAKVASSSPATGSFCWTEFACADLSRCKPFYENVFGWKFKESENTGNEMQYLEFSSSDEVYPDGALYEMKPEMFGGQVPPAHIELYITVDDVDAAVEKARGLGATVCFGPYDIPNVGRFAVITDPTGANFAMITLKAH
jgi:predicted enzyme related to lactoylglutathione lyase